MALAATAAGWIGALGTASAYALVSRRRIEPDSRTCQSINVVGAGLLAVSAAASGAWPSVTTSLVWVLIGIHTLVGVRRGLDVAAGGVASCGRGDRPRRAALNDNGR